MNCTRCGKKIKRTEEEIVSKINMGDVVHVGNKKVSEVFCNFDCFLEWTIVEEDSQLIDNLIPLAQRIYE